MFKWLNIFKPEKLDYSPHEVVLYLHDIGLLKKSALLKITPSTASQLINLLHEQNSNLTLTRHAYDNSDSIKEVNRIMSVVKYCEKEIYVMMKHKRNVFVYIAYHHRINNEDYKLSLNMALKDMNLSDEDKALLDVDYYNSLDSSEERRAKFESNIYGRSEVVTTSDQIINQYRN